MKFMPSSRISVAALISTVAGDGGAEGRFLGDGGPVALLGLRLPIPAYRAEGVAVDTAGNIFIADTGNRRVRKVSRDRIITTVAGVGPPCAGALRVRKLYPDGTIDTIAGIDTT